MSSAPCCLLAPPWSGTLSESSAALDTQFVCLQRSAGLQGIYHWLAVLRLSCGAVGVSFLSLETPQTYM